MSKIETPKVCRKCGRPTSKRICAECKRLYDGQRYGDNKRPKINSVTQRKHELMDWYRGLKTNKPCIDCGGTFHFAAMDFDHLPQYQKKFEISWAVRNGLSKEKILEELAKTVLLCANCHRVRTFNRLKRGY